MLGVKGSYNGLSVDLNISFGLPAKICSMSLSSFRSNVLNVGWQKT